MDRTFDIWLDGSPLVDLTEDSSFGTWLDGAPVLDVNGANIILVGFSATFAGSTTLDAHLSQIAQCSAEFIGFTEFTADMMVVPYGEAEDSPPYNLPDTQLERSVLPPMSGSFSRPFGISQRIRTCRAVTCCEDEAVVPAYSSTKKFVKTYVAVGFYSDRPLMGQESFNLSPTDYALADEDSLQTVQQNLASIGSSAQGSASDSATDNVTVDLPSDNPASGSTPADEIAHEADGEGSAPIVEEVQPDCISLVDNLSVWQQYVSAHPGYTPAPDTYPAGASDASPTGQDVAHGIGFQLNEARILTEVRMMLRQNVTGGGLILQLYQGAQITGFIGKYWWPISDAVPLSSAFTLINPFPLTSGQWVTVTFRSMAGIPLSANTPYVIVIDPLPDPVTNPIGGGSYSLGIMSTSQKNMLGFVSGLGTTAFWDGLSAKPVADVLMSPYIINRMYYPNRTPTAIRWQSQDFGFPIAAAYFCP
jgi:hypothetical protein